MNSHQVLWISALPGLPADWPRHPSIWNIEFATPEEGIGALGNTDYAAIVLDFPISDWTAAELLEQVQRQARGVPVLIRDPGASLSDAVRLAHLGVYEFLESGEQSWAAIERAIEERRTRDLAHLAENVAGQEWGRLLVGTSREMRRVCEMIRLVGSRRSTVLITGESGTGKELAARALHLASKRRTGPMVAVNCNALPENLLESELFGHVRGAFTGAVQGRTGRFEQANGGTIFLDEIGELPMDLQAKLLRVLQEREFQRVGSSETVRVDLRVVAATNCDLLQRIDQGKFREDLYYRLNVVPLEMPALRQRRQDIPALAEHFVEKICRLEEIPLKKLTAEAVERLCGYSWPGNVRQLENAVEMAVALSEDRIMLTPADFPLASPERSRAAMPVLLPLVSVPEGGLDYERTLAVIERSILDQALLKTGGNKKAAAAMLKLKRTTLSAKVRSLELAACG